MLARKCKILVTGAAGQLGQSLKAESVHFSDFEMKYVTKKEMDLTNVTAMRDIILKLSPDVIVNTAAYTAVDAAENYRDLALSINQTGVNALAAICKEETIALIHISTDYVFDGLNLVPYTETDATNPQTIYGTSKLAGEDGLINERLDCFAIIRTSWLYSVYGHNFMKTMLRLGQERDSLLVVNDQRGAPTLANDLARAIFCLIPQLKTSNSGIYHFSNSGVTTWFDFACFIFEQAGNPIKVLPVTTAEYPTTAKRPQYSVLNCDKIRSTFGVETPNWQISAQSILPIT